MAMVEGQTVMAAAAGREANHTRIHTERDTHRLVLAGREWWHNTRVSPGFLRGCLCLSRAKYVYFVLWFPVPRWFESTGSTEGIKAEEWRALPQVASVKCSPQVSCL